MRRPYFPEAPPAIRLEIAPLPMTQPVSPASASGDIPGGRSKLRPYSLLIQPKN